MKHVYVAGPYTGDTLANTHAAIAAGNVLLDAGLWPYVPHLSHYWHEQHPHDYEAWMALDFAWVRRCDALLRMPGTSSGADREVALATEIGIPVFRSPEEVIAWAR